MWNFKGYLWNSTQNILPIHWKLWILFTGENLRALRFKSLQVFLKRPPCVHSHRKNFTMNAQIIKYQMYLKKVYIHYVIMSAMASQITSLTIVYSTVYSGADQRKHQSSTSLAFVSGIHRWLVNSLHKGPVTRNMLTSSCVKDSHIFQG